MNISNYNTLINFTIKKPKSKSIVINNYNSCNLNNCDVDKLINTISDKFNSNLIKDKLILEFYETLYNEVIIHINEIFNTFQNSTIQEVVQLYNENSFLTLIAKISTIKSNLIANFCDPDNLPKSVNIFVNNYVENLYTLLYSFRFMINYIDKFDKNKKCCEILSSLESIRQYIDDNYSDTQRSTLTCSTVTTIPLRLKEPYNTYVQRHGFPVDCIFITSLLADITVELGI